MEKLLRRITTLGMALILGTGLNACSVSQTSSEEDAIGDELPVASAETDAVPLDTVEDPSAVPAESFAEESKPVEESVPSFAAEPAPALTQPDPMADPAQAAPPAVAESTPPEPDYSPAPAAESVSTTSATGEHEDYTVQKGDTLMKIAFEVYGDIYKWKKILEDNQDKITSPNNIPRGTVLRVEKSTAGVDRNGEKYLIKNGDTLGTISNDVYGTTSKWRKLWENNKQLIKDPNRIFAGFYLYYTMSAEDQQELDQKRSAPTPLADESEGVRNPAASAAVE